MKKTRVWVLALAVLMLALPIVAQAETMYVDTPNGGSVNLRIGPDANDEILTSVPYGQPVEVIEFLLGGSFVNVSYNGYYGYIALRYLSNYPPYPNPTFVPAPTVRPNPNPRPTKAPNPQPSGNTLEKELAAMFKGFVSTDYEVYVVPSTPTTYVNMRWAPSKSAPVRAQYWANNTLRVLSENGSWSEVYDSTTGATGFIMSSFLKPAAVGVGNGSDS